MIKDQCECASDPFHMITSNVIKMLICDMNFCISIRRFVFHFILREANIMFYINLVDVEMVTD